MDKQIIDKLKSALYDAFMDIDSLKLVIGNRKALLEEIFNANRQDIEKVKLLICKLKDFDLEKFKSAFKNLEKAVEESFNAIVQEKNNQE